MASPTPPTEGTAGVWSLFSGVSISQLFKFVIAILFARFIARGFYRVYFHPLAKFPGPKLRAFSRIPNHISTWRGTYNPDVRELHRKYGHFVRVNPDEISVTDPNAWKDIYGHGTKGTAGSPPHRPLDRYGTSANGVPSLIQEAEPSHSQLRKIFMPAFSERALKQQEPLFVRYADKLVSKLREGIRENPSQAFDMVRMYNFTTFDIMGDLAFGESLQMLDKSEYDPWVSTIFEGIKVGSRIGLISLYPIARAVFTRVFGEAMNKVRLEHLQHIVTRVTKRLEKGSDHKGEDLWNLVLNQKGGRQLTRDEMDSNAGLFMVAGTETTASVLSGLTYYLLTTPETMKKLVHEIRGAFASANDMTMEELAALPYLAACIKEALRLYPPLAIGLPRRTPETGSTVCGHFIAPGNLVVIPQHVMFTNERNFKRGLSFIPERWLGESEFDGDEKQAVQPFSVGSDDCMGKNMANHEMRLLIAKVLYAFDLELLPESRDWRDQKIFVLWEKKPLMCKLRPVN